MVRGGVSREVCLFLGRAMLWRICDESGKHLVPHDQKERVSARLRDLGLDSTCNPVKKVPLLVDGYDAEVVIDEYCGDDEDGDDNIGGVGGGGGGGARGMALGRAEMRLMSSNISHLRQELRNAELEHLRQLQVKCRLYLVRFNLFCFNFNWFLTLLDSCCAGRSKR
jgi:hypothetical protein